MRSSASRAALACCALLALGACGELPELSKTQDGDVWIVPESYHRASVTGGHVAHVGAHAPDGGVIACRDCHEVDVRGFKEPGLGACRSCHEHNAGFHHGGDAGLADGGALTCLSCHPFWVREGDPPVTNWVCLNCHAQPQGQKRAIEVHEAACFYCHVPHRDPLTQPPDCVVCHDKVGLVHGAKAGTGVTTCMQCHEQHTRAEAATKGCLECHSNPKEQKRAATLVTAKALTKGHESCGDCHVPHKFRRGEVKACEGCHSKQPVLAKGTSPKAHAACTGCHQPHAATAPPKTCQPCHQGIRSAHPVKPDLPACMACHPMHEKLPQGAVAKECKECHDEPEHQGMVHAEKDARGRPMTCATCHGHHRFSRDRRPQEACGTCHEAALTAVGKVKKDGHAKCGDCHAGLPHKPVGLQKDCADCHKDKSVTGKPDAKCQDCHEAHSGAADKSCASCHKDGRKAGAAHCTGVHPR